MCVLLTDMWAQLVEKLTQGRRQDSSLEGAKCDKFELGGAS
jgi:hypothetical protein